MEEKGHVEMSNEFPSRKDCYFTTTILKLIFVYRDVSSMYKFNVCQGLGF